MINGKYSYLLTIETKKEDEDFRNFVKRVTGKEFVIKGDLSTYCGFLKFNQIRFLEVSQDLLDAQFKTLTGWSSHVGYPSNRRFVKDVYAFINWYENEYLVMKNVEIIKNIPHASTLLPEKFLSSKFNPDLTKYVYKMADIGVDELFKFVKGVEIKAKYSRLFCDVERFKDDSKEPMSKLGQGYIYRRTYDGTLIIRTSNPYIDEDKVINDYYDSYHSKLNEATKEILSKGKDVLILDLHSYSDELANSIGKYGPYPDICIGINKDFDNQPILNLIISKIKEKGYSYRINFPYEGAIVPTGVMDGTIKGNVDSIMIEVNKRLYL